jgi:protein-disulfide isomerase
MRVGPTLEQIRYKYGDRAQIVFKHLPLPMHSKARDAHEAAEAANLQGAFWGMHDKIFADMRKMSPGQYLKYARELGLDVEKFKRDVKSDAVEKRIEVDIEQAARLGVTGTPVFFVNGRILRGAQPFASFKRVIDQELAAAAGR